jgi:SAM-dependent methyltransferase
MVPNATKVGSQDQRNATSRRTDFKPQHPQEHFIVPLIKSHVEQFLGEFLTEPSKGKLLLDVGCGSQPLRSVVESSGITYFGLDVAPISGVSIDFVCPIDHALPDDLRSKSFDFVVCTEVMEHVADWPQAFKNLAALLRPGGILFLTCPHVYQLHEEPFDFFRPTVHAIQHFARLNGLTIRSLIRAGNIWDLLGTVLANCTFLPAHGRFSDRWVARLFERTRKHLIKSMASGRVQRYVRGDCFLYLSNVALIEKPLSPQLASD